VEYVSAMGSVHGKVVLITGAANGIGAEVARRLHDKGAKLVLTDLDEILLKDVATRLGEDRVLTVVADVRDRSAMESAVAKGSERFGGIDIVMANAGIGAFGSVLEIDPEAFKTVIDVNLMGVFYTVWAALPSVVERRGYVLVVSSLAAFTAGPGMASYLASKAGVEHFANGLRLELAHRGVDVGSAHMSWIDTPLVRESEELTTFGEMISKLPGPLKKTTSVEKCGEAFINGIEGRKSRIYCPGWVGLLRWLRPLIATPVVERDIRKFTPDLLPRMDAEAAALGRHFSARTEALEKH
jgi:NAD(P)-dependent dehydrogenase (short-subunit alcohol dehydrogenase family)